MKSFLTALAVTTTLTAPGFASAKQVVLSATMKNYGGPGAYLAIYVTDANGAYKGTLWVAGGRSKYYGHLRDWASVTRGNPGNIASITGASVGAGRTLEVIVNVADNLIDAGYQLHVDAAAEDMREGPSEVVIPFTSGNAGSGASGRRYIGNFQYSF